MHILTAVWQGVRVMGWLAAPIFASSWTALAEPRLSTNDVTLNSVRYREWALKLERATSRGDTSIFERSFDLDALLDVVLRGIDAPPKAKQAYRAGINDSFLSGFAQNLSAISNYKLLRVVQSNGQWSAWFRLLRADGGLNYHELYLSDPKTKSVRIEDVFIAIAGERMSSVLRREALGLFTRNDKSLADRLPTPENDFVKHQKELQKLTALWQQHKPREVLAIYDKLPVSLQEEKFIMTYRLLATRDTNDGEYEKTITEWRRIFPNDPFIQLVCLDSYVMRKQHNEALAGIGEIDKAIGGDPYLGVLRANQFRSLREGEKARQAAMQALTSEPTLASAYDCLLSLSLESNDFNETVRLLKRAEIELGLDAAKMVKESDEYEAFRASAVYREWQNSGHKKK